MLVQQELIKKIKDFGLNSYEAKIWTALLSRGVSSAGELSDIANVPRSRTYDVLESLEKKGFIIMKLGKPIKYMAIHPNEVLNVIKKKIKEESSRQEQLMEDLKTSKILEELSLLHTQGIDTIDHTELVGILKGRENVYDYMERLVKNAKKSVHISTTADGFKRKADEFKKAFQKAAENNVSIKVLTPMTKTTEALAAELKNVAEVKYVPTASRFIIVDGTHMVFMITNDSDVHPSYEVGVWVNTNHFTSGLIEMFESNWKKTK